MKKIVVEHLEPELSKWVLIEYRHAYKIAGESLLITGIKIEGLPSTERRFYEIFDPSRVIILDPQAKERLRKEDLQWADAIVIGGILGDHPPRGRTKEYLSDKFPQAIKRNIGDKQFSIDGAVYIAYQMLINDKGLEEIPYTFGILITTNYRGVTNEIYLPYAYPLVNGRPLISEELIRYLIKGNSYELRWGVEI
ncbi:MAG: hypothetical protein QXL96_12010 [Ignisphaera sp.]